MAPAEPLGRGRRATNIQHPIDNVSILALGLMEPQCFLISRKSKLRISRGCLAVRSNMSHNKGESKHPSWVALLWNESMW